MATGKEVYTQWRTRMGQSGQRMKDGATNTLKSQSGEAIKAKDRMVENHAKAMAEGKWEEGLRRSGDEKWRRNFVEKGVGKVMAGIDANSVEIEAKFEKVATVGEAVKRAIADMPKGTFEDSVNRVTAAMRLQQEAWKA